MLVPSKEGMVDTFCPHPTYSTRVRIQDACLCSIWNPERGISYLACLLPRTSGEHNSGLALNVMRTKNDAGSMSQFDIYYRIPYGIYSVYSMSDICESLFPSFPVVRSTTPLSILSIPTYPYGDYWFEEKPRILQWVGSSSLLHDVKAAKGQGKRKELRISLKSLQICLVVFPFKVDHISDLQLLCYGTGQHSRVVLCPQISKQT